MVNELVTNAYKYAFEGKEKGAINITLNAAPEAKGRYQLTVQDDGIGLPDGFDPSTNTTLGLELVQLLAQQLQGVFEFSSNGATSFSVVFSEK
jgi:two-component sensor histidine kinase